MEMKAGVMSMTFPILQLGVLSRRSRDTKQEKVIADVGAIIDFAKILYPRVKS